MSAQATFKTGWAPQCGAQHGFGGTLPFRRGRRIAYDVYMLPILPRLANGNDDDETIAPCSRRPVRLLHWRVLLSLFFCLTLALAPSLAEARAGGGKSSFGSRGARTFEQNNAAPITRSTNPVRNPGAAGDAALFRRDGGRCRRPAAASSSAIRS